MLKCIRLLGSIFYVIYFTYSYFAYCYNCEVNIIHRFDFHNSVSIFNPCDIKCLMTDNFNCLLLGNCIKYVKTINELSSSIDHEKSVVNLILLQINGILGILFILP